MPKIPAPFLHFLLPLLLWGAAAGAVFGRETGTDLITLRITIDHDRLFHPETGWFVEGPRADHSHWKKAGANYWTHDSHPARAELVLPNGKSIFAATVDFRLFGGMSRMHPQKSFSLSCRKKYGAEAIKYPIFGDDRPAEFKYLVARNAGSDWGRSYLRDALLTGLLRDPSWELDLQAARPARVYINGRYWGLYHLREKINPHWLAERFGIDDKDKIDLLEGRNETKHGSRRDYDELMKFIQRNDLAEETAYRQVRRRMDVDNFQRLQIAQIYFDNQEAGGNLRYWRDRTDPNSRYRWVLYDVDQGFGLHAEDAYQRNTLELLTAANGPVWPNPPWVTRLQRNLLANAGYRTSFVNRTLDYLQTDFAPATVVAAIDRRAQEIRGEIPLQAERWKIREKYWPVHVERLREFARERPAYVREHFRQKFGGGEDRKVTVRVGEGGLVILNDNISLENRTYEGLYFQRYPVTIEPVAHPGFRFAGWSDGATELKRTVSLKAPGPYFLQANFEPLPSLADGRPTATDADEKNPAPSGETAANFPIKGAGAQKLAAEPSRESLTNTDVVTRLSVALVVFVLIGLYASIKRGPE